MLQTIEERMEDQLLEKERFRFNNDGSITPPNLNIGPHANEDLEKQMNQKHLDKLVAEFKSRELKRWLRSLILQTPNDQELGAAIREWYNKTEGKFI